MDPDTIKELDERIAANPEDEDAYIERGKIHWAYGRRREAMNDYLKALDLNPRSNARHLLEQANAILSFFNKDLYNP